MSDVTNAKAAAKLQKTVGGWLKKMGLVHSFEVNEASPGAMQYQLRIQRTAQAATVLIADVGFGISRVLPVLVLCYYVPKGSIIIFEQPEIHLHPAVQTLLADVFVDAIKQRDVQIIIESHSEHLLRRIQRNIAEGKLSHDDVAMYFCTLDGGALRLESLGVDMFGYISNWPTDFFGDITEDLYTVAQAYIRGQR